jgi:hypothetical protein
MQAMNGDDQEHSKSWRVEQGLKAMVEMERERDDSRSRLEDTQLQLRGVTAELAALNLAYQRLLTEIEGYRRERDHAVARRAEVEAVFDAALLIMQKHQTKTVAEETATVEMEEMVASAKAF